MKCNNLFFHNGESLLEKQQIMLDRESTVNVIDGHNEFTVHNVKKIEIKTIEHGKVKITLGQQVTFISPNGKIAINKVKDKVYIEMLNSEEQLAKYANIVNTQEAHGIIDYILEHTPDLYSIDTLSAKSLEELRKLKESMDDLANCY